HVEKVRAAHDGKISTYRLRPRDALTPRRSNPSAPFRRYQYPSYEVKLQPMSIDHQEQEVAVPKRMIPPWLLYSLLTILVWGVWGATSKAVANDINPYMNQVLFTIGLVPVLSLVVRSPRLAGGKRRKRGVVYAF